VLNFLRYLGPWADADTAATDTAIRDDHVHRLSDAEHDAGIVNGTVPPDPLKNTAFHHKLRGTD
jgi:hypothetical protein